MALETVGPFDTTTVTAAADLSGDQYKFVTLGGALAGAAALSFVLQDKPAEGETGTLALRGCPKVIAGGTISKDAYVTSKSDGTAVAATTGNVILGIALGAASSGDVVQIFACASGAKAA